ncbi:MAG TPA: hypothetical protein VNB89_01150, partial [Gemmatimonadaceae bacterium]|nr:hypothetical protein [Gemmatimonadaceae bacterium]
MPLGRDGKGNDNSYGNNNSYSYSFNRISRIVPDQVGCYVRTAKPSGRKIPDQSDRRRVDTSVENS